MKTYLNFTSAYCDLIRDVYEEPEFIASPRGMKVKERLGHSFRIENIRDRVPYVPEREFSVSYMIAEFLWYLSGNDSTEWIANYSSFWNDISDDGVTANSAYGRRIFRQHQYHSNPSVPPTWTQWQYLKDELKSDPDSRRAVIHIRLPQDSVLAKKDVPCTLSLQFFIRDGELHQVVSMRSSDLILGIAYDIPAFTLFQELLAKELDVELGTYTHISNSLHLYERHFAMAEKIIANNVPLKGQTQRRPTGCKQMPAMPGLPPMTWMLDYEAKLRSATGEIDLQKIVQNASKNLHRYWRDWIIVLASHRASKLGLPVLKEELLNSVSFKGYSQFKK